MGLNYNLYDALNIDSQADLKAVKKAYTAMALIFHPDRTGGDQEAAEIFKQIGQAGEVLKDNDKRAIYDEYIETGACVQSSRAYKMNLCNTIANMRLYDSLTDNNDTAFQEALSYMRNNKIPLSPKILAKIDTAYKTCKDTKTVLKKLEQLIQYTPLLLLFSTQDTRDTLLHLFAKARNIDGINCIFNHMSPAAAIILFTHNTAQETPLMSAISEFVYAVKNKWTTTTKSSLTKQGAQELCNVIKLLAQRTYALLPTHQKYASPFKNYVFGEPWLYIGFLLDQVNVKPTDSDKKEFPLLNVVSAADCKVSYDAPILASFQDTTGTVTIHTPAQLAWYAHQHSWLKKVQGQKFLYQFIQDDKNEKLTKLVTTKTQIILDFAKRKYKICVIGAAFLVFVTSAICIKLYKKYWPDDEDDDTNDYPTKKSKKNVASARTASESASDQAPSTSTS